MKNRVIIAFIFVLILTSFSLVPGESANNSKLINLLPDKGEGFSPEDTDALSRLSMVEIDWLMQDGKKPSAKRLASYLRSSAERRRQRLDSVLASVPAIIFLRNTEFGNAPRLDMSLSDGPYNGKPFKASAAIMMLTFQRDGSTKVVELLSDPTGMIRDLDVSHDATRVLFSWKKSTRDDFHLYEMTVVDRSIRQITREEGVADIQARYMPDGRILYHSTRCVSVVDCNESIDVVNIYTCNASGGDIVRLTFDQVSTQFPSILHDGRIVFTRWDYNDRGQIYTQGLFTMSSDGTHQTALYGNNSWYPTSLIQARAIPGSTKLVAIASGHHTPPCGKLALLDVAQGREEGQGITLLAPERKPQVRRADQSDQDDVLFQYPFPLNEDEFLVGSSLFGKKSSQHFAIYWMHRNGARELLACDLDRPYRHPMALAPRPVPVLRPQSVDSLAERGSFYVDDIYNGEGLRGVTRGTIKRLRVIALDFRPAAVGTSYNKGVAGNARVCTPVSISGAWDTKRILGDATIYPDGSAFFHVDARTAVYFQALDDKGQTVQSMRSWSTLQPGESFSCGGCHESKNSAPSNSPRLSMAAKAGPQELQPFYGPTRGFSFLKEIQPILDANCVRCHRGPVYTPGFKASDETHSFSLLSKAVTPGRSQRLWTESYISLLQAAREGEGAQRVYYAKSNRFINWISPQSGPSMMETSAFGALASPMISMLRKGHNDVKLSAEEMEKLAAWLDLAVPFCGDYTEANSWSRKDKDWYESQVSKRERLNPTPKAPEISGDLSSLSGSGM